MNIKLVFVSINVTDYDAAIAFYEKLDYVVFEDEAMGPDQRWITMKSPSGGTDLAFSKVSEPDGRMMGCLSTDDVYREYDRLKALGVPFEGEPVRYPWATGVLLKDPFGNQYFLSQENETEQ